MKHQPHRWIGILLLAITLSTGHSMAADPTARKLAFERDATIWIANLDGTGQKKIATDGQWPDLSPDGTLLAYTSVQDVGHASHRRIAVVDLATGKTKILKDIPVDSCTASQWSPDGKRLLVSYLVDSNSRIAIVNADGSGFRNVLDPAAKTQDYWSASWAADGQSIFTQDMDNLFRIDPDGKVLKKWVLEKLFGGGSMSSSVRLDPSPDGKSLLMDVEMDEDARKGWDGPPPAIWLMDLATEKVTRLTPKKFYAWDCHWLTAPNTILYASQKPNEDNFSSIYRMSTNGEGKDSKLLIKNGSLPSTPH